MKTTSMSCPNCGYFIDVKDRDGIIKCAYCDTFLTYSARAKNLTINKKQINRNQQSGVVQFSCKNCGALIDVYNHHKTHGVTCRYCGAHYTYRADSNDIKAGLKRDELDHEKWKIKQYYDHEDAREERALKEQRREEKKKIIQVALIAVSMVLIIFLIGHCFLSSIEQDAISDAEKIEKLEQLESSIVTYMNESDYFNAELKANEMYEIADQLMDFNEEDLWKNKQKQYLEEIESRKDGSAK